MADSKVSALTELTTFSGDEEFYVVEDDDGTPLSRRITIENLATGLAGRTELTTVFAAKGGFIAKRQAADVSRTSTTVISSTDVDLTAPIAASESWVYDIDIQYTGEDAGDLTFDVTAPVGAEVRLSAIGYDIATTTVTGVQKHISNLSDGTGFASGGAVDAVQTALRIRGTVLNSTNAGTVAFTFAQRVSNGTATVLKEGSSLTGIRV